MADETPGFYQSSTRPLSNFANEVRKQFEPDTNSMFAKAIRDGEAKWKALEDDRDRLAAELSEARAARERAEGERDAMVAAWPVVDGRPIVGIKAAPWGTSEVKYAAPGPDRRSAILAAIAAPPAP